MASRPIDSGRRGARSPGDDGGGGKKKKGLLWFVLGLLALLLLVALLVALLTGGEDKPGQASQPPSSQPPAARPPGGGGNAAAARLTAGGRPITPTPAGGLSATPGQDAAGRGVTVQSVVKDQGFWVGGSARDRVYVEFGGQAGKAESRSAYVPKAGQKVNLTGPVRAAPKDPEEVLKLKGPDAALVRKQNAYVNADTVEPAGG
jgi:hypothetical protein